MPLAWMIEPNHTHDLVGSACAAITNSLQYALQVPD